MRLTHIPIPVVWISTWIGRHAVPYFRSVLLVLVRAADAADLCRIGSYCFASLAWSEDRSATCFRLPEHNIESNESNESEFGLSRLSVGLTCRFLFDAQSCISDARARGVS